MLEIGLLHIHCNVLVTTDRFCCNKEWRSPSLHRCSVNSVLFHFLWSICFFIRYLIFGLFFSFFLLSFISFITRKIAQPSIWIIFHPAFLSRLFIKIFISLGPTRPCPSIGTRVKGNLFHIYFQCPVLSILKGMRMEKL